MRRNILPNYLKIKSLAVYGLPHIHIKELLPTNLPAIETNELRMDNLFLLKDGTIAIIDYESTFGPKDVIKYAKLHRPCPQALCFR